MDKEELIRQILELEWPMFHTVNGEERASCQDDRDGFLALRRAQYLAWSEETLRCYLQDLQTAKAEGRNLAREKYIRMMESTDPENYQQFLAELPAENPECRRITEEIWAHMLVQTRALRERFPFLMQVGRPLTKAEEQGWPSVENYQCSELRTYSEPTLRAYLENVLALEAAGRSLAEEIQINTVRVSGFSSLEEAETRQRNAYGGSFGGGCCR